MLERTEAYAQAVAAEGADQRTTRFRATVDIVDPDAVYAGADSSGEAAFSAVEQDHDKVFTLTPYNTLERNLWVLDGTVEIIPEEGADGGADIISSVLPSDVPLELGEMGRVSRAVSGDDGAFSDAVWFSRKISNLSVLQAASVYFPSDEADGVPVDFTVDIMAGGTAFYTREFQENADSAVFLTGFTVWAADEIRVTITRWSLPGRRARVVEIVPGIYETWELDMVAELAVKMQSDVSCMSLPYGTCSLTIDNTDKRFEPRRKDGLFQSIKERQGMKMEIGVVLADGGTEWKSLGTFYQKGNGWKTSDNDPTLKWELVDIVGLLSDRTFLPPDTLPTTLGGWISALAAQLGVNFENRWSVDPDYEKTAVTARGSDDVAGKKCGDILRWACQASGTWPRAAAETGYLTADPLWDQGGKITLSNILHYPSMAANTDIAALIFTLADGLDTEVVVTGTDTAADSTLSVKNPFIHTKAQATEVAKAILSCYGGNQLDTNGRGDPACEIGDVDTVELDESNATTGRRIFQTFNFVDGVLQNCQSRLLQADGAFLFKTRVLITEDSQWTGPEGVTKIFAALGGGGTGSTPGTGGKPDRGTGWYDTNTGPSAGIQGRDGSGGKIWYGTININEGQTFQIHIGKGGAASNTYIYNGEDGEPTTLGTETSPALYSSENGKVYDPAYTDIYNGDAYGRSGVSVPLDGTSDGAKGGSAGSAPVGTFGHKTIRGYWYTEETPPGKGGAGRDGADGFCLIYYNKGA